MSSISSHDVTSIAISLASNQKLFDVYCMYLDEYDAIYVYDTLINNLVSGDLKKAFNRLGFTEHEILELANTERQYFPTHVLKNYLELVRHFVNIYQVDPDFDYDSHRDIEDQILSTSY